MLLKFIFTTIFIKLFDGFLHEGFKSIKELDLFEECLNKNNLKKDVLQEEINRKKIFI